MRGKRKYNKKECIAAWLMISPQVIGFLVFTLYPILWVFRYAFFRYDGVHTDFIGLDNFIRLFTKDLNYWKSILNTFLIAYGKLIIEFPLALGLAVAVNRKFRGSNFFRVMFYLPCVISTAIIGLIFNYLFSAYNGTINNLLIAVGIISKPINWFGSKNTAMFVIMLAAIWQGFGQNMLYLLAGLQGIPKELYEAAEVDGAGSFTKFKHITLPMLMPILQVLILLASVYGMQIMDLVMVTTNGGPAGSTNVVMLYIYQYFFETNNSVKQWGYASALGAVTSLIIGMATAVYLKISSRAQDVY